MEKNALNILIISACDNFEMYQSRCEKKIEIIFERNFHEKKEVFPMFFLLFFCLNRRFYYITKMCSKY